MSSSGSEWMLLKEDRTLINSLAEPLLVSISDITTLLLCLELEKENFIEIGCYLYRASSVIMELQTTENTPTNAINIFQSLSKNIDLGKEILTKFQKGVPIIPNLEVGTVIEKLEGVIKHIGEDLSSITSSTYQDQEYVEIAVRSISKDMKSSHFEVTEVQETKQKEPEPIETDLYAVSFDDDVDVDVDIEVSMENPQFFDTPNVSEIEFFDTPNVSEIEFSGSANSRSRRSLRERSSGSSVAQYIEPLYETFFCPLTKEIMDDPVTIETGVTYERKAITEWCEKFENPAEIFCPNTGKKIVSGNLSTNMALKAIIEEWKVRNEVKRIKIARAALSVASTETKVLEAIRELQSICSLKNSSKVQVINSGVVPIVVKFLKYKDRSVRCATLELLQQLADDDDDECKEMLASAIDITMVIKMLSSNHQPIRHTSLQLLLELSKSQSLCEKIGSVTGGILMLITIKYKLSSDALASEKADEILKNLERSLENVKRMAENGYLEPLLNHLIEGSEEMKMEMAISLGEIVLGHTNKTLVAERASPALIKMVQSGSTFTRKAAFKALNQISSYNPNGKSLIEAGIVQIMVEEMFKRTIHNEPMNSKKEAASILANILEYETDLESLKINNHGRTVASDYIVYNIIYMIKNSSSDELNISLIRLLLCLTKSTKSTAMIVSVVKETEVSYNLIELINDPNEELGVVALKLLITLSPYIGHTLADRLCKTRGQPESLILSPSETTRVTEKNAVAANFLAKLPHQNLILNLALLNKNTVPTILQSISQIQRSGTRTSRYTVSYLEGLVGILVRFTTTLYEHEMLFLARDCNFSSVFTELLMKTSSDEVQRLSAIGLENLSLQSVNLSKLPQIKKPKYKNLIFLQKCVSFKSSKVEKSIPLCPIHRGACSSQDTFCLVECNAVERLLACLDSENVKVVEAALSAISTLLDERVNVENSVNMLSEVDAIKHVLNVVREHKEESVWKKSFWVIERFLMNGGDKSASDVSEDRLLPATLVSAFHHGDGITRQMAEKILMLLNKMPNFTSSYTM